MYNLLILSTIISYYNSKDIYLTIIFLILYYYIFISRKNAFNIFTDIFFISWNNAFNILRIYNYFVDECF